MANSNRPETEDAICLIFLPDFDVTILDRTIDIEKDAKEIQFVVSDTEIIYGFSGAFPEKYGYIKNVALHIEPNIYFEAYFLNRLISMKNTKENQDIAKEFYYEYEKYSKRLKEKHIEVVKQWNSWCDSKISEYHLEAYSVFIAPVLEFPMAKTYNPYWTYTANDKKQSNLPYASIKVTAD